MDRWPSGRRRTIGNRVYPQRVPWVRIPLYPPFTRKPALMAGFVVNDEDRRETKPRRSGFDYKRKAGFVYKFSLNILHFLFDFSVNLYLIL